MCRTHMAKNYEALLNCSTRMMEANFLNIALLISWNRNLPISGDRNGFFPVLFSGWLIWSWKKSYWRGPWSPKWERAAFTHQIFHLFNSFWQCNYVQRLSAQHLVAQGDIFRAVDWGQDGQKLTIFQNARKKGSEGGEAGVVGDDNFRAFTAFNAFTAFLSVSWEKCLRHRIFRCDGLLKAGNWTNHKLFIQLPFCILHIVFI